MNTRYGAGDGKLGSIVGKDDTEGRRLRSQFLKNLPALKILKNTVTERAKRGYLIGLDGRHVHVRSEHAALNTLLQSAGALVAKQWLVEVAKEAKSRGYTKEDYKLVGFIHDETQWEVRADLAEEFGKMVIDCSTKAGEVFKFKVPIGAEYSIGMNWHDTH